MVSFKDSNSAGEISLNIIVARIICVFAGVCHFGSLLGFLIPLILQSSTGSSSVNYSFEFLATIRDLLGIFTAVIVFFSSRYAISGLIILIILNSIYSVFWMNLISVSQGIMILGFGFFLYLSALVLLHLENKKLQS